MKRLAAYGVALLLALAICLLWTDTLWPASVLQITGFILAAGFIVAWGFRRWEIRLHPLLIPLALLALWPLLQLAAGTTVYGWRTGQAALYWVTCLSWFFVALQMLREAGPAGAFLRFLAFFSYVMALLGPLQHFTAPDRVFWIFSLSHSGTAMGPFPYANHYAGFVEMFLPISLYGVVTDARFRVVHMAGSALLYTSTIAAASRAGFSLATAAIAVTVTLIIARSIIPFRRLIPILLRSAAVAAILIAAVGPLTLVRKFSSSDAYATRRQYLRSSVAMVRDRPLMGVGMGNWATVYPGYAQFDDGSYVGHARNDWAQWAAEGGLPFLAIAVWFAFGTLQGAHRTIWGYGLAAVFIHSWVDFLLDRTALAVLFFVLAGMVAAAKSPPAWD